jgi:hypothetical protein
MPNIVCSNMQGFIQCSVRSNNPVILEYSFADNISAESFKAQQDLISNLRREIPITDINTVLEYR